MKRIRIVTINIVLILGVIALCLVNEEAEVLDTKELIKTNKLAVFIGEDGNYSQSSSISESGYTLNEEKSNCNNGAKVSWDYSDNSLLADDLTKSGTVCYLYFDKSKFTARDYILGNIDTIRTRDSFSSTYTSVTTKTIFTAEDDDGISYYYAGAPTDNWFKFAGYYWRIVRINGDGTIRLIYNGTSITITGEETQIGTSAFNSNYGDNMYVGYMYTSGEVHGYGTSSTIKGVLDSWYDVNLASYESYIDTNAGFCNDRQPSTSSSSSNGSGGTYGTDMYYAGYIRIYSNPSPILECMNNSDLFTVNKSLKGNKKITYPIGLIIADETLYAGSSFEWANSDYYLYTNQSYWTMTPYWHTSSTLVCYIEDDGSVLNGRVNYSSYGVRPVINLRADVTFTGNGTTGSPYEVV